MRAGGSSAMRGEFISEVPRQRLKVTYAFADALFRAGDHRRNILSRSYATWRSGAQLCSHKKVWTAWAACREVADLPQSGPGWRAPPYPGAPNSADALGPRSRRCSWTPQEPPGLEVMPPRGLRIQSGSQPDLPAGAVVLRAGWPARRRPRLLDIPRSTSLDLEAQGQRAAVRIGPIRLCWTMTASGPSPRWSRRISAGELPSQRPMVCQSLTMLV